MAATQTAIASNINIQQIAESLTNNTKYMQSVVSTMAGFNKNLAKFASIDSKKLSQCTSNFINVYKSFLSVVDNIVNIDKKKFKAIDSDFGKTLISTSKTVILDMIKAFKEIQGQFENFNFGEFRDVLMSSKSTKTTKGTLGNNSNIVDIESTVDEKGGLLDAVNLVIGTFGQMNNLVGMGLIKRAKFKIHFNQLMKTFRWTIRTLFDNKNFGGLSPEKVNTLNIAMKSLSKLMMTFPSFLESTSSSFLKLGVLKLPIKEGVKVLLGTQSFEKNTKKGKKVVPGKIGLVEAIILTCEEIKYMANDNSIDKSLTKLKNFGVAIHSVAESFAMVGFFAIPIQIAVLVLMGKNGKGGLLRVLVGCLNILADVSDKQVDSAINNINKMSKALLLFSATVVVIALLGALIVVALPLITITFLFIAGLLFIFSRLGSKIVKHEIKDGAQSILNISLAVTLLALTAVLIVTLAQFISAEWKTLAMFGVALVGLLAIFAVLSSKLVVKEIEGGAKSILKIALCIALMALVAVGLVWISNYVHGDWESLLQIGVMMLGLAGTLFLISLTANKIDASDMVKLTICTLLLSAAVGALAVIGQQFDLSKTLAAAGIMAGIALVVGGVLVGLSFIPKKMITQGEVALAVIVACAVGLAGVVWILSDAINKAGDMKKVWGGVGVMSAIIGILVGVVLALGALALSGVGAIMLAAGTGILGGITLIAMGLSKCVKEIAVTAAIMKTHNLDKKALENTMKMPIEVIKSIITTTLKDVKVTTIMAAMLKFKPLASISEGIGTMATVLRDIALLNIPTKLDEKGNPIEWRQMNATDFENAGLNAAVCASILTKIFTGGGEVEVGDGNGGKKTIFVAGVNMDEIEDISYRSMIKFKCITNLSSGIGNLAQVIKDIASFSIPSGFNEDGTPKDYRAIDPTTDLVAVGENVALMVGTIVQVFGKQEVKDAIKGIDTGFLGFGGDTKAIEAVFNAVGHLSGITTLLGCIARGKMPYEQYTETDKSGNTVTKWRYTPISQLTNGSVDTNIKNMITTVIKGFTLDKDQEKQLDLAEDNIDDINKVVETGSKCITTLANAYTNSLSKIDANAMNSTLSTLLAYNGPMKRTIDIFDSYSGSNTSTNAFDKQTKSAISFLKQVNDTDLSKLKQTTSLFEEIRKFSQSIRGDFEELAECINEEIITAIEKLEETLTKIKDEGFNVNVSGGTPQQPTVNDMKPTGDKATQATIKNLQDKIKILENGTNAALRKLGGCIDNGRMKVSTES